MAKQWAAYVRVSSDKQEDRRQRKAIRERAKDEGRAIPDDLWFADEDSRDQWENRPGFCTLKRLIERGQIEGVYIEKFDRFGVQDFEEWAYFRYLFRQHDCRVFSTVDGELTSPSMETTIKNLFRSNESEAYQKDLGRKVLSGKLDKSLTRKHPWQGGIAPFGYDKIILDSQERLMYGVHYLSLFECVQIMPCVDCRAANKLTPRCPKCQRVGRKGRDMPKKSRTEFATLALSEDAGRVEMVRKIFRWYTTEAPGLLTVTHRVNAEYLPYGTKANHDWIGKLLQNPAYVGSFSWGKSARSRFANRTADNQIEEMPLPSGGKRKHRHVNRPRGEWVVRPDSWEPIIDPETYEKARVKLERRSRGPRVKVKAGPWLGGLVYCGTCKKPMGHREGYNPTSRGKLFYRCTSYAASQVRQDPCECGCNTIAHEVVEPLVLDYFRTLKIDLDTGTDRDGILKLYAAKNQTEDLLASTVRRGLAYYAERIREAFGLREKPDGKLARLVAKLCPPECPEAEGLPLLAESIEATLTDGPADVYLPTPSGPECVPPQTFILFADSERLGGLVREIEETKQTVARQMLDQLQGEFDTLTRAKALAESDRERRSLQAQVMRLEERMDELEEHLTPLSRRRDELRKEIDALKGRIADAEEAFADGDSMRKAQAVRDIIGPDGMILCNFEYGPRKTPARPSRQPKSKPRKRCEFRGIEVVISASADDSTRRRACGGRGRGR